MGTFLHAATRTSGCPLEVRDDLVGKIVATCFTTLRLFEVVIAQHTELNFHSLDRAVKLIKPTRALLTEVTLAFTSPRFRRPEGPRLLRNRVHHAALRFLLFQAFLQIFIFGERPLLIATSLQLRNQ
jgi:hypothetical protein